MDKPLIAVTALKAFDLFQFRCALHTLRVPITMDEEGKSHFSQYLHPQIRQQEANGDLIPFVILVKNAKDKDPTPSSLHRHREIIYRQLWLEKTWAMERPYLFRHIFADHPVMVQRELEFSIV